MSFSSHAYFTAFLTSPGRQATLYLCLLSAVKDTNRSKNGYRGATRLVYQHKLETCRFHLQDLGGVKNAVKMSMLRGPSRASDVTRLDFCLVALVSMESPAFTRSARVVTFDSLICNTSLHCMKVVSEWVWVPTIRVSKFQGSPVQSSQGDLHERFRMRSINLVSHRIDALFILTAIIKIPLAQWNAVVSCLFEWKGLLTRA